MQRRSKVKTFIASAITITGVVVFALVFVNATAYSYSDTVGTLSETHWYTPITRAVVAVTGVGAPKAAAAKVKIPDNYPVELRIPTIKVDAHVQYVGVAPSGHLAVPTNFTDVAWYKGGTIPGDNGAAIFDGHLDDGLGLPAVFWNLSKVTTGDDISVLSKGGKTLHFNVQSVNVYDVNDPQAVQALFASTDVPTFRLITCDGDWDPASQMYTKRIIVVATLVN